MVSSIEQHLTTLEPHFEAKNHPFMCGYTFCNQTIIIQYHFSSFKISYI